MFTTDGHTDGRTDRHSSNVLEFCGDQMSPSNIGSQIIISRCYKRIDKTNIPALRRVYKNSEVKRSTRRDQRAHVEKFGKSAEEAAFVVALVESSKITEQLVNAHTKAEPPPFLVLNEKILSTDK